MLDPDMPAAELRLHMGELTAQEVRTARAAIRWANWKAEKDHADRCEAAINILNDGANSRPYVSSAPRA